MEPPEDHHRALLLRLDTVGQGLVDTGASARHDLAEETATFIARVWTSVFEVPLMRTEPHTFFPQTAWLSEEAPLPGRRAVRLTCERKLCHWIASQVFGEETNRSDDMDEHESLLEVARAIGVHARVIEHPAWPWTSEIGERCKLQMSVACELWFSCRGSVLQVALTHATTRPTHG